MSSQCYYENYYFIYILLGCKQKGQSDRENSKEFYPGHGWTT